MPLNRRTFGVAVAAFVASAGLTRCGGGRADAPFPAPMPELRPWEWEPTDAASQGVDGPRLEAILAAADGVDGLSSVLVVRNGRLIGERYCRGATQAELQPLNSVTKSVVSLLVGQALERGWLPSLSSTVGELLPEAVRAMPNAPAARVTLAQILSGRAGLQYDWLARYDELMATPDLVRMAFGLEADLTEPTPWTYNDPAIGLIAPIWLRATGEDIADFAARELFAPLGIARYAWARDRAGHTTSFAGLALRPRDLMKLLWLLADRGAWDGRALVPGDWIDDSTRSRGSASWRVEPIDDIGYGLLWFTGLLHGQRVVWGWGYGGQFALWVPRMQLAVTTTAASPEPEQVGRQTAAIMALLARVVETAR